MQHLMTPFHDRLSALRRRFHEHPELCYQEHETSRMIREELAALGVPFEAREDRTWVIARLKGARPGPAVGFRADMDALPMEEMNDVPYRSKTPGRMHACGHDGHVTTALGTLRLLLENGYPKDGAGEVLVFFQPAEEGGAGAKAMIEESGIFSRVALAAVFAGHMDPELPAGEIAIAPDVCNARSDSLHIRVTGRGGHGAHPHLTIDPILPAAQFLVEVQSVISRNLPALDSAVLTFGRFQAGTASNIVPEHAYLDGTLRTLGMPTRELILGRVRDLLAGLEAAHHVTTDLALDTGYPLLANDPALAAWATAEARALLGEQGVHPQKPRMGSEDYSYFAEHAPSVMLQLGCREPGTPFRFGLHSPYFDMDERCLDVGARLFARLLLGAIGKATAE